MRLLVTGGAGFIGANFVHGCVREHPEDSVTVLDALTYAGSRESLAPVEHDIRLVQGDITDAGLVSTLVAEADAVVHFAAETHVDNALADPEPFVHTNVIGTFTVLEAVRAHRVRLHHVSTDEVYGDLELDSAQRFTESSPYNPSSPYSSTKAAADMLVRAWVRSYRVAATISNCSNNYGPFQHPEKAIPLFTTNALDDRPLPLYRQSANRREWLHVDDHCRAIELVLERGRPGETYNVGSGDERSIEDIADAVLDALGKPRSLKTYVEDRPGHDRRYLLDHSKIERELGWRPRVPFGDGLSATVRWYAEHRDWWTEKKRRLSTELDEFAWRR
jgi:dTDP-glucose 4,6-dehydratase